MQISATTFLTRWRTLIATTCLLAVPATPSFAQLRFAGPANQAELSAVDAVSPAQFQPIESPSSGGMELAPLVPPPGDEASIAAQPADGEMPPAPPAGTISTLPGGEVLPAPVGVAPEWEQPPMLGPSITEGFEGEYGSQLFDGGVETYSTRNWFRRGRWYSQQDIVVLMRTDIYNIVFSGDSSITFNQTGLGTKTVAPTFQPGTRISLGRFLGQDVSNRDHAVEFQFFGLFDYSNAAKLTSSTTDSLRTTLNPAHTWFSGSQILTNTGAGVSTVSEIVGNNPMLGFDDAQEHTLLYQSDLNSYEINYRVLNRPMRDHLSLQSNGNWVRHASSSRISSLIVGLRGVSINELLEFNATFNNPTVSGSHRVRTVNNMFGLQGGAEYSENHDFWSIGLRAKGGALYNFTERGIRTRVIDGTTDSLAEQNASKYNLAGLIEGGVFVTYQLRPNLGFRAAYDALYITGIADAPQNAGLDPGFPTFEVTADAVYHGASFGLEMLW